MGKKGSLFFMLLFSGVLSCAQTTSSSLSSNKAPCPRGTLGDYVYAAELSSQKAMNAVSPDVKVKLTKKGMEWADKCVLNFPDGVGCYYYRAVNTGLYYEVTGLGYQKGLKKIMSDCYEVIRLDKTYDQGGAYRILGNIYLKVPNFSLAKNAITKDIDKARDYAKKGLEINSNNLENRLLLAQVEFEDENFEEAHKYLKELDIDYPKMQDKTWYDKKNVKLIKMMLEKVEKKLTNNE